MNEQRENWRFCRRRNKDIEGSINLALLYEMPRTSGYPEKFDDQPEHTLITFCLGPQYDHPGYRLKREVDIGTQLYEGNIACGGERQYETRVTLGEKAGAGRHRTRNFGGDVLHVEARPPIARQDRAPYINELNEIAASLIPKPPIRERTHRLMTKMMTKTLVAIDRVL